MNKAFEHNVVEYLEMFDADSPDFTKMMSHLAPDARYLNIVTHAEPLHGRAAIEAGLRDQYTRYKDCECKIVSIASNGSQVFTERADTVTMRKDGRKVVVLVCAVFDLNEAGQITYWREYWDMGDIKNQLATTAAA
jgi:limonene-1,2-epoxide hydrolase